jgi:hypothetical protein
MKHLRMTAVLCVLCSGTFASMGLSPLTSPAAAGVDHFSCQLWPAQACSSEAYRNWDRVRARYDGSSAPQVRACVYMSNLHTGVPRRGGVYFCAVTWTTNPIGWNFGDTFQNYYQSHNDLASSMCCSYYLYGWTSDNQTDG